MTTVIVLFFFQTFANEPMNIAVASNFTPTMKHIISTYQQETGKKINILSGATGKHYLQIIHGAPIHLFFAADEKRPYDLVEKDKADSSFNYAIGELVYWKPSYQGGTISFEDAIKLPARHISIAHPQHAPYGLAAKQTLKALSRWDEQVKNGKYVYAENVNQSHAMVTTKAVQGGFVAYSQIKNNSKINNKNTYWIVPNFYYNPIKQNAVIIKQTTETNAFMHFFKSDHVQAMIQSDGYELP